MSTQTGSAIMCFWTLYFHRLSQNAAATGSEMHRGDNSCYLLQLITRKPQTRWRTWSDSNARRVNTVKSSPAKQRGPRYETVHASIKELDEGKQAKALMVIEIGFLRGCQLAHQDVRQHQAPGVKRGPPLQSVWLETVSSKHGGTALARRGIRDLRGQDLDLRLCSFSSAACQPSVHAPRVADLKCPENLFSPITCLLWEMQFCCCCIKRIKVWLHTCLLRAPQTNCEKVWWGTVLWLCSKDLEWREPLEATQPF